AAHCLYGVDGTQFRLGQLHVVAGVSNYKLGKAQQGDLEQDRGVRSFRIHPYYRWWAHLLNPDDVAGLELSRPPDLSGPDPRSVSLPTSPFDHPARRPLTLAGFGRRGPGLPNGPLVSMQLTPNPKGDCGGPGNDGVTSVNAITFCTGSKLGGTCAGDSGAGLITNGSRPQLVGIVSAGAACKRGTENVIALTGPGEILRFLHGDDT